MNKTIAEKIFEGAIKLPTPQERAAYVRGACGEELTLRQQVESLIQAHEEVGGFMPTDPAEAVITLPDRPLPESEGTCIGRYKLLQKIGEGRMGVIYMAEQTEPVTRRSEGVGRHATLASNHSRCKNAVMIGMNCRLFIFLSGAERGRRLGL
jgi:hypothetical protein